MLDRNKLIPRTTKWRLSAQHSITDIDRREDDDPIQNKTYSRADFGDEEDAVDREMRCVDDVEDSNDSDQGATLPSRIVELDTPGNVYLSLEVGSEGDELSSDEEEGSCESDAESESDDAVEAGVDCNQNVSDSQDEDNLLLYSNAEISKLTAHVIFNLFVMEHKLSNQAAEDLIRLINLLLPGLF